MEQGARVPEVKNFRHSPEEPTSPNGKRLRTDASECDKSAARDESFPTNKQITTEEAAESVAVENQPPQLPSQPSQQPLPQTAPQLGENNLKGVFSNILKEPNKVHLLKMGPAGEPPRDWVVLSRGALHIVLETVRNKAMELPVKSK
jgi:hypothetical protein